MITNVNIKTTVLEYKKKKENEGKIAVYDINNGAVIQEGNEDDWLDLQLSVDKANVENENLYLIIVPYSNKQLRSFSWR